MKDIVFCADGTWNHPKETTNGKPSDTNVRKFYDALVEDERQVCRYDAGVGVGGTLFDHLVGGAFGEGLLTKVKEGYAQISEAYVDGDRIHLFGFSRGAYTARSIAGMIAECGLPKNTTALQSSVETVFSAYRSRLGRRAAISALWASGSQQRAQIATVGVWDTVGALGIPLGVFEGLDEQQYGFLDTSLHPDIQAAYHAISIDERRQEFKPTLWSSTPTKGQILMQIWFSGVHCDVGGGYPVSALSDITFRWMIRNAIDRDIRFAASALTNPVVSAQNSLGKLHDSWAPYFLARTWRAIPANAQFGSSVEYRYIHDGTYRPENLPGGVPGGHVILVP